MKKQSIIFNLIAVILCGLTTPATADFCGQSYDDCCEWSVLDGKMTLGADWLYWKVQQDGILPGAIVETNVTTSPLTTISRKIRPDFKYESGFRVNLGYELPCDCWDVNLAYTYLPSHAKTKRFASNSDIESFSPSFNDGSAATYNTFASKWDFSANNIDLDIGRTVCFGECLKVRPHIGFRTTWFDQKLRILASAVTPILDSTSLETTANATALKEKFDGYGVEGGLWTDWKIGYGVSVVGHVGGSILYSKFKVHATSITGVLDADLSIIPTAQAFAKDTFHSATPTVDYFIGLQYADCMFDMFVKAHIGWEQHVFFDTNRFLSAGNLSTQGLTLGLDVGF